jgi:large subunit ribosomal protein L6
MIEGVVNGYSKTLEMFGVGYRFQLQGNTLVISVGFSHLVKMPVPNGLQVEVLSNTEIVIKGISKELVGEFAAVVRKIKKPEPYKGKGIRYKDEHIRRKEGKKAAK